MRHLLIAWHSATGGTRQLAEAVAEAARAECGVSLLQADGVTEAAVLAADGYVFATPENLASMAGPMKTMFDRLYYPLLDRIQGRPYACVICAGTDGEGAARQVARIATGWRLRAIAPPLIVRTGAQTPEAILAAKTIAAADRARAAELGAGFAAGLESGVF